VIKLSNSDGRFIVRLLEQRRAAILEMMQRLPDNQAYKARSSELRHLDAVLTQIKSELPQIADPEVAEAVELVDSL
jgi:hypothetical protein